MRCSPVSRGGRSVGPHLPKYLRPSPGPSPCDHPPAHSAANVKKWEVELQTLRESNARLSSALQESVASAEQWKRQFSVCRDENDRLRSKVTPHLTGPHLTSC